MSNGRLDRLSFWIDLGERAVQAFAQGTLAGMGFLKLGTNIAPGDEVPWAYALEFGGTMAAIAVLTGLSAMKFGDPESTSFLPAPPAPAKRVKAFLGTK